MTVPHPAHADAPNETAFESLDETRPREGELMADRVLLIGKRAAVLTRLQAALGEIGIEADLTRDVTGADRGRLGQYAAVAFGRRWPRPTASG
jgi:hypothetical protein